MRYLPPVSTALLLLLTACGGGHAPGPAGVPALIFEPAVHVLGAVSTEAPSVVPLPWRRTGAGPLRVLGTRLDCGCAALDTLPEVLAAGSCGQMQLRLHPPRHPGPFRVQVRIYTTAPPPHDRVLVEARGHVGPALAFFPARLDFGRRSPGVRLRRLVEVRWDTPPMSGGLETLSATLERLDGSVRVAPPAGGALPGCLLELELVAPLVPGPFQALAQLREGERLLGSFVVRGVVE